MSFGLPLTLITPNISFDEIPNHHADAVVSEYQTESLRAPLQGIVSIEIEDAPAVATELADRGVAFQEVPIPKVYLWQTELDQTYNARQCIADHESRRAGMYTAEYGGTPSGKDGSDASGISQWMNSPWRFYVPQAEAFYGLSLISRDEEAAGARLHAAYAPPFVQDLVTAFAFKHRDLAQNQKPWPYLECWLLVDTPKVVRPDGSENGPTPYVLSQLT